jgi:2',3'-cyclic-nucleotide 2'-phosphodiesterase (5'-nucleotidase family)
MPRFQAWQSTIVKIRGASDPFLLRPRAGRSPWIRPEIGLCLVIGWAFGGCVSPRPAVPPRTMGPLELRSELVVDGTLEARLARPDGASLVVFYTGEQKGSLDPCGCPERPRGGVGRTHSYVQAARAAEPSVPSLLVDGGYFLEDAMGLDGNPRADVPVLNRYMVEGLGRLPFTALNVGYNDLSGLTGLSDAGTWALGSVPLPLVSANAAGPGVVPYRIVEAGPRRVAITGITAPGVAFLPTPGFQTSDPVESGRRVLTELRGGADLVVLLSFQANDAARTLAEEGLVDVVIDTNLHTTFDEPFRVGKAIWLRSHLETMRLGELRLWLEDGRIARALDRKIDLDDRIPSIPEDEALASEARVAVAAATGSTPGNPR